MFQHKIHIQKNMYLVLTKIMRGASKIYNSIISYIKKKDSLQNRKRKTSTWSVKWFND